MRGWETVGEAGQLESAAWNNYKTSLLDQAVNDLGINRVRLEIKSGVENPTDYFTQWRNGQIDENNPGGGAAPGIGGVGGGTSGGDGGAGEIGLAVEQQCE